MTIFVVELIVVEGSGERIRVKVEKLMLEGNCINLGEK